MKLDIPAAAGRTVVALILLASGVHKSLAAPEEFAAVLEKYYLLPPHLLLPLAKALPAVEVLVGTALLLGWRVAVFSSAAMAMFGVFIAALVSTMARGIPLEDCGCFGKGVHIPPAATVALDSVLISLSYLSLRRKDAYAWLDRWVERGT